MNRYQKANEGIHGPEPLKRQVIHATRPARRRHPAWWGAVAAGLVLAIAVGAVLWPGGSPLAGQSSPAASAQPGGLMAQPLGAIVQAEYPHRMPYPDVDPVTGEVDQAAYDSWWAENQARQALRVDNESMADYYAATMAQFLGDNGGENAVYSPLNLYLALAMLAEGTDGDSRAQLLNLLGVDSIEAMRAQAANLWNANYRDDGQTTSLLANSVWLDEGLSYNQDALNTLADVYYASSYQGEMGSDALNQALQDWLNEQTGGLLEEYAQNVKTRPETLLALASTIYFQASWSDEFDKSANAPRTFHTAAGGDVETDFMNQSEVGSYFWGEGFSAVAKPFRNGGEMWLILPDEGTAPEELLAGSQLTEFLMAGWGWENRQSSQVNLSMPKFDVSAQTDLVPGLKQLGVTDVFDAGRANFTPMLGEGSDAYVSQATQAARVKVDEKGCQAAAFTTLYAVGGAPLGDEIDFVLDRPFLFAITSQTGQLLFVGVVNQV